MSRSDFERPSASQVRHLYACRTCGNETEIESWLSPGQCACGGSFDLQSASYPADPDDWDECRPSYYDDWARKR